MPAKERVYTPDMGEISGFGGGYEAACRAMVLAGLAWWDEHPEADPKFRGMKNVYGILADDNDDAKALTDVMVKAAGGDCTGAMHQATVSHVLFIHGHSWDEYAKQMREREKEETK